MTDRESYTLALDVMGTDNGPGNIIAGGIQAARDLGVGTRIILVGHRDHINKELETFSNIPENVEIHHADGEVAMTDHPADAVRRKDTSISEAVRLHREGKVDGIVSPGNTGAVMGTVMLNLGRLRQVKRPAIASFFPSVGKRATVVLDVGANSDCKSINLRQFAVMGSVMARQIFDNSNPRVGLLSIGQEKSKGNELIRESFGLLEEDKFLNFVGNIEGRDILMGKVDVAVTDGFVGNIVLKFAESIEGFLTTSIHRQVSSNMFSRVGAMLMSPFLRRLRNAFDYSEYGGAPLLGINGVCIICHGDSSAKAICKALKVAREMIHGQINKKIETVLLNNGNGLNGNSIDTGVA